MITSTVDGSAHKTADPFTLEQLTYVRDLLSNNPAIAVQAGRAMGKSMALAARCLDESCAKAVNVQPPEGKDLIPETIEKYKANPFETLPILFPKSEDV